MGLKATLNTVYKSLYLHSPLASERGAERLHKAVWLSRFQRWCNAHPCPTSHHRPAIFEDIVKDEDLSGPISYLEFGVFEGRSMRWWLGLNRHPESRFYGFDTFTGLPENWERGGLVAGDFNVDENTPEVDDERCTFIKGIFQHTLPGFLNETTLKHRRVINIDVDLYSSALYCLMMLSPHLRKGDLILFDEFHVFLDEFRAFQHFLAAYPIAYKALRRSPDWSQTIIRVESDTAQFNFT